MDAAGTEPERLVGADRVLAVLKELGEHPHGVTLDRLAMTLNCAKPTAHRALTSLRRAGFARQLSRGVYVLGDEFLRLAFRSAADRPDTEIVAPLLERLSAAFGETTHYAVLEGTDVVYRAKTDPARGAVRLTSVVGGRNPAYCTAVGKLLLSSSLARREDLAALVGDGPLPRRTPRTLTDVDELWDELMLTRERGYAVDDQENEAGVNCVAVRVDARTSIDLPGAISVSALSFRMPLASLIAELPRVRALIAGTAVTV